jgi:hypothetical protein
MGASGDHEIHRGYINKRKESGGLDYEIGSQDKNKWYDDQGSRES